MDALSNIHQQVFHRHSLDLNRKAERTYNPQLPIGLEEASQLKEIVHHRLKSSRVYSRKRVQEGPIHGADPAEYLQNSEEVPLVS